ncbi:hypothetical protein JCM10212_002873 [Sporobolomyces blumeae]
MAPSASSSSTSRKPPSKSKKPPSTSSSSASGNPSGSTSTSTQHAPAAGLHATSSSGPTSRAKRPTSVQPDEAASSAASRRAKRTAVTAGKKSLREEELGVGGEIEDDDDLLDDADDNDDDERPSAAQRSKSSMRDAQGESEEGEVNDDEDDEDDDADSGDGGVTRCVCGDDNEEMSSGLMIQCDTCKCWQHGPCVGLWEEKECPNRYFCELCKPELHGQGGVLRKTSRKSSAPARRVTRSPSISTSSHGGKPSAATAAPALSGSSNGSKVSGMGGVTAKVEGESANTGGHVEPSRDGVTQDGPTHPVSGQSGVTTSSVLMGSTAATTTMTGGSAPAVGTGKHKKSHSSTSSLIPPPIASTGSHDRPGKKRSTMNSRDAAYDEAIARSLMDSHAATGHAPQGGATKGEHEGDEADEGDTDKRPLVEERGVKRERDDGEIESLDQAGAGKGRPGDESDGEDEDERESKRGKKQLAGPAGAGRGGARGAGAKRGGAGKAKATQSRKQRARSDESNQPRPSVDQGASTEDAETLSKDEPVATAEDADADKMDVQGGERAGSPELRGEVPENEGHVSEKAPEEEEEAAKEAPEDEDMPDVREASPPRVATGGSRAKHPNQYTYRPKNGQAAAAARNPRASPTKRGGLTGDGTGGSKAGGASGKGKDKGDDHGGNSLGWAMPEHLRHLAYLLPSAQPEPLVVTTSQHLAAHYHPGHDTDVSGPYPTDHFEPPTKVRFPGKRVTMPEMKKRVRTVQDYLSRVQKEISDREKKDEVLRRAIEANSGRTTAGSGSGSGSGSSRAGSGRGSKEVSPKPSGSGGRSAATKSTSGLHVGLLPPLPGLAGGGAGSEPTLASPALTPSRNPTVATGPTISDRTFKLIESISKEILTFQQRFD